MQKPTLCIYADTHALMKYTWVYNTPMSIYFDLFSRYMTFWSFLGFNESKTSVSKRLKICLLPHPVMPRRHPSVSLRCKITNNFWNTQIYRKVFLIFTNFDTSADRKRAKKRASFPKLCIYIMSSCFTSERDDVIVVFSTPLPMVECFYMLPVVRCYYDM